MVQMLLPELQEDPPWYRSPLDPRGTFTLQPLGHPVESSKTHIRLPGPQLSTNTAGGG